MKLTDEQISAIKIIDKNVIVNAGAGTGKTETLTRRYIEILENGILERDNEVSGIVAITFTIKAANEMRERIKELLLEKNNEESRRYLRQLSDSNISTIHSFCSKLIREYSYFLNIDPLFEILEEKESNKILEEVISNILDPEGEQGKFIVKLMNASNKNDTQELINEIKNIYLKIKNTIFKICEVKKKTILNINKLNSSSQTHEIIEELNHIKENVKLRSNSKLFKFINEDKNKDVFVNPESMNTDFIVNLVDSIKSLDNKEELDYLREIIDLQLQYEERKYSFLYEELFEILKQIDNTYKIEKQKLGKYDFNDLEHLTYELLQNSKLRSSIQDEVKYIMVDEYQDSNDIQKEIFYLICSKENPLDRNNLFVVGDPKQSIYGFRGANINIFYSTREDIKKTYGEDITFSINYRSNDNLMNGINKIYKNIMAERYDILSPNKESQDKYNIYSVNNNNKRDGEYEPKVISNFIAKNILNKDKVAKDYTLLFRSRSGQEIFENSFRERNIPFYTFDSLGFYNSEEIKLVIEIFKLIKYNENNTSLYYIMKSRIYKLTDEDIFEYLQSGIAKVEDAIKDIYSKIEKIKEYINGTLSNLLINICDIFKFYELYNYEETNIQNQGNLYKLITIAKEYDKYNLTIDDFYYDLINNQNDETMKQVEDENSEVVKLMTIHGSKGLGFNDVVVPYINKGKSTKKDLVKFRANEGLAVNFIGANYNYKLIEESDLIEEKLENDNIYYVAMTRAKENLVLGFSGIKSGYKKVIYDDVEKLLESEDIKEIIEETDLVLEKHNQNEIKLNVEFPYMEEITLEKDNLIKSNISAIIDFIGNDNKIMDTNVDKYRSYKDSVEREELNLPDNLVGNIVHRYAEMYKEPYNIQIDEILQEFGLDLELKDYFKSYIDNFKNLYNYSYKDSYEEVEFNYRYKNFLFRGIIDRIEIEENIVRIVDYKFSNLNKNDLINKYWAQLIFYGMVCEKIFINKKIELVFKNIRKNYYVKVDFSKENISNLESVINDYINEIYKMD